MASLRATTLHRTLVWLPCLALAACASLATEAQRRGGDTVTEWTLIGDFYGNGAANWRTLAVLHTAMHDALNANASSSRLKHHRQPCSFPGP